MADPSVAPEITLLILMELTVTSQGRKRNCRLRLDFSIVSMSVTATSPPCPHPRPIIAKFFSNSQPMAPAPTWEIGKKCQQVACMDIPRNWKIMSRLTRKYFCWLSLTCNSLPNTAICPSYRQCFYQDREKKDNQFVPVLQSMEFPHFPNPAH